MHNGITYVTGGSLDGENTALDVEEGNIESTTTKVVDQDVALLVGLAGTETVGNGSGGRLVDDTENVEARDGTSVLGSLSLVVVEVGWDSDDSLLDLLAELDLSDLFHLFKKSAGIRQMRLFLVQPTLPRTMAEISCGEKVLVSPRYSTCTFGWLPSSTTLKGHDSMSFLTVGSSYLLPIRRLTSKTVLAGFMAAWFLAASPMRRSSEVKETKEGVNRRSSRKALRKGLTDLNAGALIVGNARVGRAQVDANGTVVHLVGHLEYLKADRCAIFRMEKFLAPKLGPVRSAFQPFVGPLCNAYFVPTTSSVASIAHSTNACHRNFIQRLF
ncbi:hypothetical protein KC323_g176 [Hortaea werneckii]|nr:hypothetical protein KC323_g176 [Hortaea werneckii]